MASASLVSKVREPSLNVNVCEVLLLMENATGRTASTTPNSPAERAEAQSDPPTTIDGGAEPGQSFDLGACQHRRGLGSSLSLQRTMRACEFRPAE